jgi:lipopolysaccharide biosynthesis regulator YciM
MTFDPFWLLSLPILFGLGWFASRLDRQQGQRQDEALLEPLSKAIDATLHRDWSAAEDALIHALRINPEAIGLQSSVGVVLRLRGEPDRAIEVHQALLARTQLSELDRQSIELELAEDYRAAGILDRAENLLKGLAQGPRAQQAHQRLLQLMQRQRRWAEALQSADWLAHRSAQDASLNRLRFHFHMELGQREAASELLPDHPRLQADPNAKPVPHQCRDCGAKLSRHAWQCPACEAWDSLRELS